MADDVSYIAGCNVARHAQRDAISLRRRRARSLVLSPLLSPRRAQEAGEQGGTLLVAALVDVVDCAHHEHRGG